MFGTELCTEIIYFGKCFIKCIIVRSALIPLVLFYFSPIDMIGWTILGSLSLVLITGFSPEATTVIILITNFMAIFQHANIKTPQWIGYVIQRPESHSIHHGRGIHAYNYSGTSNLRPSIRHIQKSKRLCKSNRFFMMVLQVIY